MTVRAHAANPEVLRWARECLGLSIKEVCLRTGYSEELIESWEEGSSAPTFRQLEKLAETIYKRPVAVFFFPKPPQGERFQEEFRTLPGAEFDRLHSDTRLALREARAYQVSLEELPRGANFAGPTLLKKLRASIQEPVKLLARRTRKHLRVSIADQQSWGTADEALKVWRRAVEESGIFVFKRSMTQKEISGFCLHHEVFPVIMINNGTAHTRQIFTLFHELAHLLHGLSSITTGEIDQERFFAGAGLSIEVRCNAFAAEFLVPDEHFPWSFFEVSDVESSIETVADRFNVSRELILRKLKDAGRVPQEFYDSKAPYWASQAQDERSKAGTGGSYYLNQVTYLSRSFARLAFAHYHSGRLSKGDLADMLGLRAKSLDRLEDRFLAQGW